MSQLEDARKTINEIDSQMAALFEKRMQAVEDVIAYKIKSNLPILDSGREQEVIENNSRLIENEQYKTYYIQYIQKLMELSKQYQRTLLSQNTVGYQGVQGAFSHLAATRLFPSYELKSYPRFSDVFDAVEQGELFCGVIPFENSYTGEVGEVLDLLFARPCYILDIFDLKVDQNLLGLPQATLSDIKRVYSHPQAIGQCQGFLSQHGWEAVPYINTAMAAKHISEMGDKTQAAIASAQTAAIYGLKILASEINTSRENTTRFIVIGRELPKKGNRFNLLFTVSHDPGSLARVMQMIGNLGFNLESIKSRPHHDQPWQYYFYAEVMGDLYDEKSQALLGQLKQACKELKILGIYTK